jgi:hypothetical protein
MVNVLEVYYTNYKQPNSFYVPTLFSYYDKDEDEELLMETKGVAISYIYTMKNFSKESQDKIDEVVKRESRRKEMIFKLYGHGVKKEWNKVEQVRQIFCA